MHRVVAFILLFLSSAVFAVDADVNAPELVSWSLSPTSIDTSESAAEVIVTLRITDDSAGAKPPFISARHETGQSTGFASVTRIEGDALDGTYKAIITVPQGSAPGTWSASLFPLEDAVGNQSSGFGPGAEYVSEFTVAASSLPVDASQVDSDDDGIPDLEDAFPNDGSETKDNDSDGVGDNADLFDDDPDESSDNDGDGVGDNSDLDDDNDGVADTADELPLDSAETLDTDADGTGNNADTDDDGDGVPDKEDAFPLDASETLDANGNGIGDIRDALFTLRDRLQLNILDQRMVSYLGRTLINLMSDLEDRLDFGGSEDWTDPRGVAQAASFACEDGGGYDIRVTRTDFTALSGTVIATNCQYEGLTVSGTVAFEYDDEHWYQDTPMQNHPLTMTFRSANIRDGLNRSFTYTGAASCDWRFNNSAYSDAYYRQGPDSFINFGDEYDGHLIVVSESGSRFDLDKGGDGWAQRSSGLEFNTGGKTANYPLEYPNCDITDVDINHANQSYKVNNLKYIGEYDGLGYRITTLTRQQRKLESEDVKLIYARDLDTGEVLYNPPFSGINTESFNHPELGQYSFAASGGSPGTYRWASRGQFGSGFYQETYQTDHEYLVYLSGSSDDISANNTFTPWFEPNVWNLGFDLDQNGENDQVSGWRAFNSLWTVGTCGRQIERYEAIQLFIEYAPDDRGVCQRSNGFYIDSSGNTVFSDINGDGNNEIFDADDDDDGYLDVIDAFPMDDGEWLDTDGDGLGDNADFYRDDPNEQYDSDGDGTGDNADRFPQDSSETFDADSDGVGDNADLFDEDPSEAYDTDLDGTGNNADLDDDNDGFSDSDELDAGTDPLSASSCPGCFNWDIDNDGESKALTDGLIMIRHLFGFNGDSLTAGAIGGEAGRATSDAISDYLTGANAELDVDGDGESKALTDGLLLIRYLFGFSGDSLISGAIGNGAERYTAEEVEAYIEARLPPSP